MSRILQEKRNYEVEVARWCPEKPYIELLVPEDVQAVSQVVFRTDSHDQGYSGEAKGQGTYEFSYTWFVANTISPGGIARSPRQVVQYNVHASSTFKRHEVIWNADSESPSIREWVRSIRGGDIIQLIPKAQWAGWINFVREAEIEVRCSDLSQVSTSVPPFYRHLDESSSEIRLLSLDPGAPSDPVSCSLIYSRLGDHPPVQYESLSYCWGNAGEKGEITVKVLDDCVDLTYTMPVTLSLLSALQAIRPLSGPARVLWVDAICINQTDFDERSSQVAMMRSIYRQAQRVVVWLGEGNDNSQRTIRLINAISDRYKKSGSSVGSDKDNLTLLHDPLLNDWNRVHSFIDDFPLFTFPWFRRTWVVQEIFNARDSIFYCGSDIVEWESLLRVNKCIPLRGLTMKSVTRALMPPFFDKLFSSKITEEKGTLSTNLEILDVLVQGLELDATDPRDKLFAMLQFGYDTGNFDSLPSNIMPNYNRPTREVFSLFTKWWINEHRSLRILSAIQALEWRTWQETRWETPSSNYSSEEIPSWSWGYRGHSNWAIGLLGLPTDNPYRASGDTLPDIQAVEQSSEFPLTLPLSGFRIGVIKEIKIYPYFQPPGPGYEDLHSAYVANFDPLNLTGKWNYQLNSRVDEKYIGVKPSDISYESNGHFRAHAHSSSISGGLECRSKCFFSTHEGSVGLCPYSARPGDLIVVLYGGNVTYVLRLRARHGGELDKHQEYEFVGECYTQGYMNGEGIQEQEKKGMPAEVFILK
ncbi:heterokaryon incompatibility protein-domain-containing protein [Hypoxylon sp. NC0597]|nr:heterokaryon incompatibility protein-domain-containing protein [Hypoxylon sp. NC0597]